MAAHLSNPPVVGILFEIQAVKRRDRLRTQREALGFKAFPAAPNQPACNNCGKPVHHPFHRLGAAGTSGQ
jgi:hypothetical protein